MKTIFSAEDVKNVIEIIFNGNPFFNERWQRETKSEMLSAPPETPAQTVTFSVRTILFFSKNDETWKSNSDTKVFSFI